MMKSKLTGLLLVTLLLLAHAAHARAQATDPAKKLVARGTSEMSRNRVGAAIESYSKAIELSPGYAEAYVKRGMARRAQGDLEGSISDYEKAGSIDPKSTRNSQYVAESYVNRGNRKLDAFDIEGAISDFDKAVAARPGESDNHYKRGYARVLNEDYEAALADLDRALALSAPGDTFKKILVLASCGVAYLMLGKEAEAERDFDACVKLRRDGRLMLDDHVSYLRARIILVRRRRAEQRRGVARVGPRVRRAGGKNS